MLLQVVFRGMDVPQFVFPLPCLNKAVMTICIRLLCEYQISVHLSKYKEFDGWVIQ